MSTINTNEYYYCLSYFFTFFQWKRKREEDATFSNLSNRVSTIKKFLWKIYGKIEKSRGYILIITIFSHHFSIKIKNYLKISITEYIHIYIIVNFQAYWNFWKRKWKSCNITIYTNRIQTYKFVPVYIISNFVESRITNVGHFNATWISIITERAFTKTFPHFPEKAHRLSPLPFFL